MQTVVPIITLLIGIYTGFYFGYLKKEGKPPEMPIEHDVKLIKECIDKLQKYIENRLDDAEIKPKKNKNEIQSWFDQ